MNIQHVRRISSTYRQYQGFTLIELMVTIAVLGIIASIATPSISLQLANMRVKSTAATLENALKEAKAESAIRRQSISVAFDDAQLKTITVTDSNGTKLSEYEYDTKSTVGVIGSKKTVIFYPSKRIDQAITYSVCDSNKDIKSRLVTVNTVAIVRTSIGSTC